MSDSIWKKEISFKKKEKAQADPEAFELPKQSFLKKELSFSRKPKEPKEPKPAKEPKAAKESIWKKDLSLGKKKDPATEIGRLAAQAAQAVEPVALSAEPVLLPQPTELAEAFVAAMPEPDFPEPVEPITLAVVPEPPIELVPAEPIAVELPPTELSPVALPPDLNAVVELPVSGLSPEILAASAEPAMPEAFDESWSQAEPVLEAEPWLAEPELPPAPVATGGTGH